MFAVQGSLFRQASGRISSPVLIIKGNLGKIIIYSFLLECVTFFQYPFFEGYNCNVIVSRGSPQKCLLLTPIIRYILHQNTFSSGQMTCFFEP